MSTIHSMKLLLLLSDEAQIVKRRDAELRAVQADKTAAQARVAALLDELFLSNRASAAAAADGGVGEVGMDTS